MLFLIPCWGGVRTGTTPIFGPPHHRQDREERQAETTADVQERSRGTTATGVNPTLSHSILAIATPVGRFPGVAALRSHGGGGRVIVHAEGGQRPAPPDPRR